jgi:myosin heavy subunit
LSGCSSRSFSEDAFGPQDSEALIILLNQLAPDQCDTSALTLSDPSKRAEAVLINAEKIQCRKFVTPADIVKGNSRLLIAFLAVLFSKYPNMGEVAEPKVEPKAPSVDLSELERLRQENAQLHSEIDMLKQLQQKQLDELEVTRRTSNDEISKLQKLIEELQSKTQNDSELEKLRQENAQLKAEIETLKSQLANNPNAAWAEKEATYQREKTELEAKITQLNEQLKGQEEKLASLRVLEEEKERLNRELSELKASGTPSGERTSDAAAPPERKGWMYKQTAKGRIIKRFLILRGDFLLFYRERAPEVVNEAKPRGALYLPGAAVRELDEQTSIKKSREKKLKFGLELETRYAKRVYFFVTNDNQVRQEWVKALNETISFYTKFHPLTVPANPNPPATESSPTSNVTNTATDTANTTNSPAMPPPSPEQQNTSQTTNPPTSN